MGSIFNGHSGLTKGYALSGTDWAERAKRQELCHSHARFGNFKVPQLLGKKN